MRSASKTLIAAVEKQKAQHSSLLSSQKRPGSIMSINKDKGYSPDLIRK